MEAPFTLPGTGGTITVVFLSLLSLLTSSKRASLYFHPRWHLKTPAPSALSFPPLPAKPMSSNRAPLLSLNITTISPPSKRAEFGRVPACMGFIAMSTCGHHMQIYNVAEKILETPLVSSVREDKVVWEEERNECYSVKSGYKLAMRYIIGSDKYHVVGNWNGVWKAQAPHKARHLLWRLCRGCLPTRSRLLERRVECTLNCPVCDEEVEDELHIFFSNESSDTVGRVAMLLWCIWHNRNDKLWNDNVQMPRQIGRHALDAWNDWYSVHKLQSNNVSGTTETDLVRWEKPTLDWVKCNVDVAFVSGSGRTSVGLCFRDSSGHFMADMTQ
ncbi:hypothetical protein TSUD_356800 [Trifolium subterraneum]|uniref:Reverse transcriptase zinc-binding domain-containing protein n=1 Tax=Trifolium subterraneum TaxID=3900 RepID=A0A2Z6P575_TRISU|nr:hypothetical protein TSUD_356800 [Trifolium subterraneum]